MALFLETTHSSLVYQGNLTDVAFDGIALMQEEMQLVEAIYQADFIMHEQNKNLSESARVLKEGNFVANVFNKVIEWAKKVYEWLKNFFIKIKDKIVEIYNRIKDHITGNTVTISKEWVAKTEATIDYLKEVLSWAKSSNKAKTADALKAAAEKLKNIEKTAKTKIQASAKIKGDTTISVTYFDKISGAAKDLEKDIVEAADDILNDLVDQQKSLDETHAKITAATDKGQAGESTKEAQNVIMVKRLALTLLRTQAASAGQLVLNLAVSASPAAGK